MPNIQSVPSLYIKVYKRPAFLVHSDSQLLPVWEMQPRWGEGVVSISSRLHENPCDRISKVELQRKLSEKDKMDWKADKTNSWCWVDWRAARTVTGGTLFSSIHQGPECQKLLLCSSLGCLEPGGSSQGVDFHL